MEKLSFKLEAFEGPLDLLLHLISRNKLDIYDINITELLDQYMDYIHAMQENDMDVASEFLEMASRLVYIKSAALLPGEEDAEELKDALAGELLEYSVCRAIAKQLAANTEGFGRFMREPSEIEPDMTYRLTHDSALLLSGYMAAVGRGMRRLPPSQEPFHAIVRKKIISVSSRIVFLLRTLWKGGSIRFGSLFTKSCGRSESVATFLAVLELVKANRVSVNGNPENPENPEIKIIKSRDPSKKRGRKSVDENSAEGADDDIMEITSVQGM